MKRLGRIATSKRLNLFSILLILMVPRLGLQAQRSVERASDNVPDTGSEIAIDPGLDATEAIETPESAGAAMAGSGESGTGLAATGSPGEISAANNLLNFQTDLFTGRFSYSIPIIVPPARQGAEPKLALTYNSASGNGWCGVGWSLEVGAIQRETKNGIPIKWNPPDPQNQYDDDYGFVFSLGGMGASLVNVGGNEYRAEIDGAFLKFLLLSGNSWEVTDKGGNKFYFGESSASRMEQPNWPAGQKASTFRWALNRIRDVNGNETTTQLMALTDMRPTGILMARAGESRRG
jgi:hypothetical protein